MRMQTVAQMELCARPQTVVVILRIAVVSPVLMVTQRFVVPIQKVVVVNVAVQTMFGLPVPALIAHIDLGRI
jgi:hypothetical protein